MPRGMPRASPEYDGSRSRSPGGRRSPWREYGYGERLGPPLRRSPSEPPAPSRKRLRQYGPAFSQQFYTFNGQHDPDLSAVACGTCT
jgi:hypothetical protein